MDKVFQENAIGVEFILVIKKNRATQDISSATIKQIIFGKPDGTLSTKTANFVTNGVDGKLSYITIDGDLTPVGSWKMQANLELSGGFKGKTTIVYFSVSPNIK